MSVCTSLTNELKNLTNLHTQLEHLLESIDEEVTPKKLADAYQLKELIKHTTKELKPTFDSGVEQVLKEKWDFDFEAQLEIYSDCKQTDWVDYLSQPKNKSLILKKFLNPENRPSIEAKRTAGMKPYLMPSREVQQDNWEQSLKDLRPYWREQSKKDSIVSESYVGSAYNQLMDQEPAWTDIPNEPYIAWTNPTQKVDPATTKMHVDDQKAYILKQSRDPNDPTKPSLLYDKRELSPLEYAVLQAMHTRNKKKQSDKMKMTEDIFPLDYWGHVDGNSFTRFPACGPSSGGYVPFGYFLPVRVGMYFRGDVVGPFVECGFRAVGRL